MADSVLIVDDHPLTREALSALLTQHGFAVVGQAADGEEAIGFARRLQPRLVLLDLSMPGLSGLEALPRLREAAPALHLRAHRALAREEPAAQARRLVPPGGARGTRRRSSVTGTCQAPTGGTAWLSGPRRAAGGVGARHVPGTASPTAGDAKARGRGEDADCFGIDTQRASSSFLRSGSGGKEHSWWLIFR